MRLPDEPDALLQHLDAEASARMRAQAEGIADRDELDADILELARWAFLAGRETDVEWSAFEAVYRRAAEEQREAWLRGWAEHECDPDPGEGL